MFKVIGIFLAIIATSFYLFPFTFTFLPTVNTKMILAVFGLVIFILHLAKRGNSVLNKDFFIITLFACGVSLASLVSMVWNDTPDGTYFSYVISMFVWTGGAYAMVSLIKAVHSKISIELICYYLIAVCVIQCLLAIAIDLYQPVKAFVNSFYYDSSFFVEKKRLYGIGCGLDIAGGRFSAILIILSFLLSKALTDKCSNIHIVSLLISFGIIAVIGNIIGRTTTIGLILGLIVIIYTLIFKTGENNRKEKLWVIGFGIATIALFVYLYNTNVHWQKYLEFGFEGFFSLVEKGKWEVHSNEMLQEGFIYPDNLKGWIIGDGYFGNTDVIDPYYTGETWYGFYKGTDAGYSRLIFYFGLTGLLIFSAFFVKVALVCMRRFQQYKYMFLMILLVHFIIWIKASTDIFLVFAPFLCLLSEKEPEKTSEMEQLSYEG